MYIWHLDLTIVYILSGFRRGIQLLERDPGETNEPLPVNLINTDQLDKLFTVQVSAEVHSALTLNRTVGHIPCIACRTIVKSCNTVSHREAHLRDTTRERHVGTTCVSRGARAYHVT